LKSLNPNLLQLTNGHDLLKAFAQFFREKGHNGIADDHLASCFRMLFTASHYQRTELYKQTAAWATQNNCSIY
jgi:hypothetical protein